MTRLVTVSGRKLLQSEVLYIKTTVPLSNKQQYLWVYRYRDGDVINLCTLDLPMRSIQLQSFDAHRLVCTSTRSTLFLGDRTSSSSTEAGKW